MDEAIKIADKICIMDGGHIVQYDTPEQILKHPKNEFVKKFVGPKRIWTNPELIKVKDIMMTRPVVCSKNLSIFKCITRMKMMKVDTLMVVDKDGTYLGSLHASRLNEKSDVHAKVEAYMDQENIRAKEEDSIVDVLKIVDRTHLSTLPVVNEEGKLTGFVTRSSLITSLSQQFLTGGEKE